MELQVLQVLALCMQAKEKGCDVFFDYMPHTEYISVQAYEKGWVKDTAPTINFRVNVKTNEKICGATSTVEEVIEYLTNLIKEDWNDKGKVRRSIKTSYQIVRQMVYYRKRLTPMF